MQIPSQRPVFPTPAGLVTTVDRDGNPNIITLGESDLRTERLDMLVFARWTFWTVGKQIGVRG